jgi:death-on-curing protein
MATALAYGIAKNHPFVDGNKRAALMASMVMLSLNGHHLRIPQAELTDLFMRLAGDPAFRREELVERFALAMGGDVEIEADG